MASNLLYSIIQKNRASLNYYTVEGMAMRCTAIATPVTTTKSMIKPVPDSILLRYLRPSSTVNMLVPAFPAE
jgi:hypothetical protein